MDLTLEDLEELKMAYNKAVESGETQFVFKENNLLVSYAKYLIEYLEILK